MLASREEKQEPIAYGRAIKQTVRFTEGFEGVVENINECYSSP